MRIGMLSWESLHSIAVGGLAAHVSELAEALHLRGHDVHVFTRMGPGLGRYDCINGVHYHRCSFESSPDFFTYVDRMGNSFVDRLAEAERFYGQPFGIVVLEAWSAARPVVVTRNGGPNEFVRDQDTGFMVSADRESIGWGLGTALSDTQKARQVGSNGRREVETRFSWNAIAEGTEGVYSSLEAS